MTAATLSHGSAKGGLRTAEDVAYNEDVIRQFVIATVFWGVVGFAAGQPTATTFVIQAVPQGRQARDSCGTMSMNQTGRRLPEGDCW